MLLKICKKQVPVRDANVLQFKRLIFQYNKPLNLDCTPSEKEQDIQALHDIYNTLEKPSKEDVLVDLLDLQRSEAKKILEKNYRLQLSNGSKIKYNINLIKSSNPLFSSDLKIWLEICQYSPHVLSHHVSLLKELNIPVRVDTLFKIRVFFHKSVYDLRKTGVIHGKHDILRRIFTSFNAPASVLSLIPKPKTYESMTLREVYKDMYKLLMKWQLDVDDKDLKICKYNDVRLKSLTQQMQVINILKRRFHFDNQKIALYPYLIRGIPEFYDEYLNYKKTLNGFEPMEFLTRRPYVMSQNLQNTIIIEALLNYVTLNPPPKFTSNVYNFLAAIVLSRIEYFIKLTSLADLRLTYNNSELFVRFHRCIAKLKDYEREHGAITVLPESTILCRNRSRYTPNIYGVRLIINFLKAHLDISHDGICRGLYQIGHIHYPSFTCIKRNLALFINEGYSKEITESSFHILIYPHDLVLDCYQNKLKNTKYGQYFRDNKELDKLLQLLLYIVDKSYREMGGSYI